VTRNKNEFSKKKPFFGNSILIYILIIHSSANIYILTQVCASLADIICSRFTVYFSLPQFQSTQRLVLCRTEPGNFLRKFNLQTYRASLIKKCLQYSMRFTLYVLLCCEKFDFVISNLAQNPIGLLSCAVVNRSLMGVVMPYRKQLCIFLLNKNIVTGM